MFSIILSLSSTNILLLLVIMLIIIIMKELAENRNPPKKHSEGLKEPPSPKKLPIIGHLHLMGGYEVPYQAFSDLGKQYGHVINLKLGNVKCMVINGQQNIREALVTKGHHFDSRPNFQRYHELFSGCKENSLAFCDWSNTQKIRRDMLKAYTFPRAFTNRFFSLEQLICKDVHNIIAQIKPGALTDLKPIILRNCANIFLSHFCSKEFNINDSKFIKMVENFDEIFYEVNQGYVADFLPFLMPLYKKNLYRLRQNAYEVRNFFETEIIEGRYEKFDIDNEPNDYVENLIKSVKSQTDITWDSALFALEDIIGGHSAVGNFLIKVFAYIVNEIEVQKKIQNEIDLVVGEDKPLSIEYKNKMPYTEAVIFETIRLIASPIVPRVANQDSSIDGFAIEEGSVLFLNNYDLSMSEKLWDQPEKFMPERFIRNGKLIKPEHFLPFGGGRRGCMGYRMVQLISFGVLGGLLQNFSVLPIDGQIYKVPVGSLALKKDTFKFKFIERQNNLR